jgi:hypothetical protein
VQYISSGATGKVNVAASPPIEGILDADVVSECKHQVPREEGIGAMHKLQEIIAVIAGATCSTGRNIRSFIVHFCTRCRQSGIVLSVSFLSRSLVMHAQILTSGKRFSFSDLQHLQSVGDVQISPDGHAIVYSVSPDSQTLAVVNDSSGRRGLSIPIDFL